MNAATGNKNTKIARLIVKVLLSVFSPSTVLFTLLSFAAANRFTIGAVNDDPFEFELPVFPTFTDVLEPLVVVDAVFFEAFELFGSWMGDFVSPGQTQRNHENNSNQNNPSNNSGTANTNNNNTNSQSHQKPQTFGNDYNHTKLLLLSGPPGCGKTTLARVVAKHCGYEVMELNASDDRSGKALI